jgi:hypothetical protein
MNVESIRNELREIQQRLRDGMQTHETEITRIGTQIQSMLGRIGLIEDQVNHIQNTILNGFTNADYDQRINKIETRLQRILARRFMEVEGE